MKYWGMELQLDMYNCDPDLIRNKYWIGKFTEYLCDMIKVKRFGKPIIVNFGEDKRVAGYSLAQLIETSLVSAHFVNQTNAVYLNIFSCKPYDYKLAKKFAVKWFKAKKSKSKLTYRI